MVVGRLTRPRRDVAGPAPRLDEAGVAQPGVRRRDRRPAQPEAVGEAPLARQPGAGGEPTVDEQHPDPSGQILVPGMGERWAAEQPGELLRRHSRCDHKPILRRMATSARSGRQKGPLCPEWPWLEASASEPCWASEHDDRTQRPDHPRPRRPAAGRPPRSSAAAAARSGWSLRPLDGDAGAGPVSGLDPWDVLHQGLSRYLPLSFGTVTIVVGAVVLLLWIPLRQKPGLGTVLNVFVVGVAADVGLWLIPAPDRLASRIVDDGRRHRAERDGGRDLHRQPARAGSARRPDDRAGRSYRPESPPGPGRHRAHGARDRGDAGRHHRASGPCCTPSPSARWCSSSCGSRWFGCRFRPRSTSSRRGFLTGRTRRPLTEG